MNLQLCTSKAHRRWIDRPIRLGQIELFVGNGDPARENELCSSLEKCGVCIDHFCQSHPIFIFSISMLSWNLLFYIKCRSAVTGSPEITKTALSWVGLGFVAKVPRGEMGVEGAHHNQAEKYIGRGRFAKSAGRAESKILIAHIFPNSSILLAWQCLWNPKLFSLRCQVSTWRLAQHGGGWQGLHC